jgi:hypothetical protein
MLKASTLVRWRNRKSGEKDFIANCTDRTIKDFDRHSLIGPILDCGIGQFASCLFNPRNKDFCSCVKKFIRRPGLSRRVLHTCRSPDSSLTFETSRSRGQAFHRDSERSETARGGAVASFSSPEALTSNNAFSLLAHGSTFRKCHWTGNPTVCSHS